MPDCAIDNDVELSSLTAGFEAWKSVTDAMAECGNFSAELDQEFRTKQPAAFAADPALYQIGGVSNGTVTPLLNEGTIRPLDDLVAKYGQDLSPNQLIRVDGQIMAVAMMVNTQHLMYRRTSSMILVSMFQRLGTRSLSPPRRSRSWRGGVSARRNDEGRLEHRSGFQQHVPRLRWEFRQ
jgi:hypothetical protein